MAPTEESRQESARRQEAAARQELARLEALREGRQEALREELRGFLIAAIQHEHDLVIATIQHERESREIAFKMRDEAVNKQSVEYERRLTELNHAHAQATTDKHAFLLKITFDTHVKDFDEFRSRILERIAAETASQGASAKLWAIAASVVTALITALVLFWTRGSLVGTP